MSAGCDAVGRSYTDRIVLISLHDNRAGYGLAPGWGIPVTGSRHHGIATVHSALAAAGSGRSRRPGPGRSGHVLARAMLRSGEAGSVAQVVRAYA